MIEKGTYAASPVRASVYENANAVLVLCMEFDVQTEAGVEKLKNFFALSTKDGALNTRTIERLRKLGAAAAIGAIDVGQSHRSSRSSPACFKMLSSVPIGRSSLCIGTTTRRPVSG